MIREQKHKLASFVELSTSLGNCTTGEVRLVVGNVLSTNGSGRVEVCFNNAWGTICDRSFDDSDAAVACSQVIGFRRSGECMSHVVIHHQLG